MILLSFLWLLFFAMPGIKLTAAILTLSPSALGIEIGSLWSYKT